MPAALVAVADVLVLYLLVRFAIGRVAAFWAGLFLVALPLHLAFSRTELVVSFTSFWTSLILLLLWAFLRRPDPLRARPTRHGARLRRQLPGHARWPR